MFLHLDCRYYRGDRPCKFNRLCEGCPHYAPMGPRTLIIKLGALGDVVRTACLLPGLASLPDAPHVTWLTSAAARPLVERMPGVDRVLTFEPMTLAHLAVERFDTIMSLDKEPAPCAVAMSVRADRRLGMGLSRYGTVFPLNEECDAYFTLGLVDELKFHANTKTYPELIYEAMGLDYAGQDYRLEPTPADRQTAAGLIEATGADAEGTVWVGINPGAGHVFANKAWREDGYVELIRELGRRRPDVRFLLLGGRDEADLIERIGQATPGAPVFRPGCDLPLGTFMALIERCAVVVSGDTLAMHPAPVRRSRKDVPMILTRTRLLSLLLLPVLTGACGLPKTAETPTLTEIQQKEITLLRARLAQTEREVRREKIQRLIYETEIVVAAMRGFAVKAPVKDAPMTRQTLTRIIQDSLARQYPGRTLELNVWFNQLFGALPEGIDMASFLEGLMGEQAAGLYDPETKLLYVREDFSLDSALGAMVLSHEITHALQDQDYSLQGMGVEETGDDDRALAVLAIAEGDATLLMGEYLVQTGKALSFAFDLPRMIMMDQQQFNTAPPAVQQTMLFPYLQGMLFFQTLAGRTRQHPDRFVRPGESTAWRGEVFAEPPETTEQIIHPEKYLARELPAKVEPLEPPQGAPSAERFENVMGEFGVQMLLISSLGEERARETAEGWNGDRALVTADAGGAHHGVRWVTLWDTPAAADRFASALREVFAKRFGDRLSWKDGGQTQASVGGAGDFQIRQPDPTRVELSGVFTGPLE